MRFLVCSLASGIAIGVLLLLFQSGPSAPLETSVERDPVLSGLSRHYGSYSGSSPLPTVEFSAAIAVLGRYEGIYEPCGCEGGQVGGWQWEARVHDVVRCALGTEFTTLVLGRNIVEEEGAFPSALREDVRRCNALALGCYLKRLKGHLLYVPDASDELYLELVELGAGPRTVVASSAVCTPVTQSPRVSVVGVDDGHPQRDLVFDRTKPQPDVLLVVLYGHSRQHSERLLEHMARTLDERQGALVVDVNGVLATARLGRWSVLTWGRMRGTRLGIIRLGRVLPTGTDCETEGRPATWAHLVDVTPHREGFRLADETRRPSTVIGRWARERRPVVDWWTVRNLHWGKEDAAAMAILGDLRAQRQAVDSSGHEKKPADLAGAPFLDDRCGQCHEEHEHAWAAGFHAHAYDTLSRRDREKDPSCLRCHSTAFRAGMVVKRDRGVSCTSCHVGPEQSGANHLVGGGRLKSVIESRCRECHTPVSSPNFAWERYRAYLSCCR